MTPILYRLAGYSRETLDAHTYFLVVKNRALLNEKGERSISFPLSVKAQEVWNTFAQRLHYMSIGARVVGGIALAAVLWKSVQTRSSLALVGGVVVAGTAEFFAQRVNKEKVYAVGQAISIRKIPDAIDDYRKQVMMTGALDPNLVQNDLPTALEKIALSLFADEEIVTLWTNHVNKNPGYLISLNVFDQLPFGHPMREAANACRQLIATVSNAHPNQADIAYSSITSSTVKFFNEYQFSASDLANLFTIRFLRWMTNINPFTSSVNSAALTKLFEGKIVQIATDPENFLKEITLPKYAQIQFGLDFSSVFQGQSEEFLEWARLEFNQFPEETPHKQLYLSCIPGAQAVK